MAYRHASHLCDLDNQAQDYAHNAVAKLRSFRKRTGFVAMSDDYRAQAALLLILNMFLCALMSHASREGIADAFIQPDMDYSITLLQQSAETTKPRALERREENYHRIAAAHSPVEHMPPPSTEALHVAVGSTSSGWSIMQATDMDDDSDGCMAADLDAFLKGLRRKNKENVNTIVTFHLVILMCSSLLILFMGHRLVTPVIALSAIFGGFFLTFEGLLGVSSSCTLPVLGGLGVGLAACVIAMCFLEAAIVIPGAMFGAVLAYSVQSVMFSVSPSFQQNSFMRDYFWTVAAVAAVVFAYIAHLMKEDIFLAVTCLLGACGFQVSLRGILDEYADIEMSALAGLGCLLAALIAGVVVQRRSLAQK